MRQKYFYLSVIKHYANITKKKYNLILIRGV